MEWGATSDLDREPTVEGRSTAVVGLRVRVWFLLCWVLDRLVNEA
jgi:hypothetical protein